MDRLPPEMLAALAQQGPPMDPMSDPGNTMDVEMPSRMGPATGLQDPMMGMDPMMGGMDPMMGGGLPTPQMMGMPMDPMMGAPLPPPPPPPPGDPALQMLLQQGAQNPMLPVIREDPRVIRRRNRFARLSRPDMGMVRVLANNDQRRHSHLLWRFSRDLSLYRQHVRSVPPGFKPSSMVAFQSSGMSNIVNKLCNMLAAIDVIIEAPFRDEATKDMSQTIEDFGYWARDYEKDMYTRSGGSTLQWDEFFYLLLHGRLCARILPDVNDEEYPWRTNLLDPATCYPTFGDDKEGMLRMTRVYKATVGQVLSDYGEGDPQLQSRMSTQLGYGREELHEYLNHELNIVEYWDPMYRAVFANDIEILPIIEHGYGFVPFIYVSARGEPKNMATPEGRFSTDLDEFNNAGYAASAEVDLAEKGVSVFHHLINTHRLQEVLNTVLMVESIKSQNPATITYSSPQHAGNEPPPLNTAPGGNNQRVLNLQKVEAIPTSPRPTDVAPVANQLNQEWTQGTIPPHVFGAEQGSNVSGFAVESLIAAAKDAILPYTHAFEVYLSLKLEMQLQLYSDFIGETVPLQVPSSSNARHGMTPYRDLNTTVVKTIGPRLKVKLYSISQQNLPGQISAAIQAVQGGIWSTRRAMEHVGERDADKMFQDIVSERAVQHPEVMENFLIPQMFINRGDTELAKVWMQMVVMPKMGQIMGMGEQPGAPPQPGEPPQPNGQSAPMEGVAPPPPGGPAPGEGRGPVM